MPSGISNSPSDRQQAESDLKSFVDRRVNDVRAFAASKDPAYFATVRAAIDLNGKGILVPTRAMHSLASQPVEKRSAQLLEACSDLIGHTEWVWCALEDMQPERYASVERAEVGRLAMYRAMNWVTTVFSFASKVELVIERTGNWFDRGQFPDRPEVTKKYRDHVRHHIKKRWAKGRTSIIHGAVDKGGLWGSITEEGGWAGFLAPDMDIRKVITAAQMDSASEIDRWHRVKESQTPELMQTAGVILTQFERELPTL